MVNILTRLTLQHFRSFSSKSLELHPGLNFIIGPNAQGKTSLLEAACVLLRLKSPLTHTLTEAIRFGEEAFFLAGSYGGKELSMRFSPGEKVKRLLQIDDVTQQETTDYLSTGCIVWFGSDDREIINGPGERRRRFLDSAGLQLSNDYRKHLKFYEKALRSRNLVLRKQRPRREVEAYNSILIENGDALMNLRAHLCKALAPQAAQACHSISQEKLMLHYQPGASMTMREALENSLAKEIELGMTLVGPHRDELLIRLNDIPTATFGSEGQRRTVALSLKLGLANLLHQEKLTPPLLLLDDVFGELDPERRSALLAGLPLEAQALLTTTDMEGIELPQTTTTHFFALKDEISELSLF
ncbi:MAG: DNA replication and repair protein RecF [Verrucomicrobia bacterium]|nr:MAG: DNA replication and repair protein RecF [Verrucomicrobiota bacterium]